FGMMPIGSLLIGAVSQYAGAQATMLGSGAIALVLLAISWRFLSSAAVSKKEEMPILTNHTTTKTWKKTARL
ncbi:MAG TPA: hypothetical protein VG605_06715, partial [Puia sp.]|nr:hypothetical protein [Puia sp.]